jgi:hypothetical protein
VLFKKAFKSLEKGSIKIFFELVFRLNNGEDDKGRVNEERKVPFKVFATRMDNEQDKRDYKKTCVAWLRCRCRAELIRLVLGSAASPALTQFFNIDKDTKEAKKNGKFLFGIGCFLWHRL